MGSPTYDRENTTRINLKLNNRTDADIIEKLRSVESIQGYIKQLIREDMTKGDKTMKYQINLTDPSTGATSAIDTVTAPEGYTAEDYINDCRENADQAWIDMLEQNTVTIEPIED